MASHRLRFVIFQEAPGLWLARGLEHDLTAEAATIGQALRAVLRIVQAHIAFDVRHAHRPLCAFLPAPQKYWNAYASGTMVPLAQLGISAPPDWDIQAAFAARRPADETFFVRPARARAGVGALSPA
ncbi:MAG TPA: hypothetical protein VHU82_00610 [Vicinamibacterales bacterium]|nr:hypothetical protein [Vicinamibacterales bacterium]